MTAQNLAAEMKHFLTDSEAVQNCRADLEIVCKKLGQGGGIQNMAALVLEMLQH